MQRSGGNVELGGHEMMAVSDFNPQKHGCRECRQSSQEQGEVMLVSALTPRNEYLVAKI